MSDYGAYEDEMRLRRPLGSDDAEFSSLAEEIRSACLGAPGHEVEARHIQAIVEQARLAPGSPVAEPLPVVRRAGRLGLLARLGAVAAGLALLTGSLAVAGVDLPVLPKSASSESGGAGGGPPRTADDEEERSETSGRVRAAIEESLPMLQAGEISGCEFGAIVSGAARGVEPEDSICIRAGNGEMQLPDPPQSETARRVHSALQANFPALHAGDISGCEFGAMVSAAARGVEPDTSMCEEADVGASGDEENTDGGAPKAPDDKPGPAEGSKGPDKSQGKGKAAGDDSPGPADVPGATPDKADNADKPEAKPKKEAAQNATGEDEPPGQGKGNGPPTGAPGEKGKGPPTGAPGEKGKGPPTGDGGKPKGS